MIAAAMNDGSSGRCRMVGETKKKSTTTSVIKTAGNNVSQKHLPSRARYTVQTQRVTTAIICVPHATYCQTVPNPLGLPICHTSKTMPTANTGRLSMRRDLAEVCFSPNDSERIRRAVRKDDPPVVIGAATTPSRARMLPAIPNQLEQTVVTTVGASKN